MLQNIREASQGWLAWFIVIAICVTFSFWGVHSYFGGGDSTDVVAKVNGSKITKTQLTSVYEQLRRQQQLQLGADYSTNPNAESELKQQALNQLIVTQVLSRAALKAGYRVTSSQVSNALLTIPAFQENGRFSRQRFDEILMGLGYTENGFLEQFRMNMLIDQTRAGYVDSAFSLPQEVNNAIRLIDQKRDIAYLTIPLEYSLKDISVSDAATQAYYTQHQDKFLAPEQVSVEYVELSLSDIVSKQNFDNARLQQFYKDNPDSFMTSTRWKINRILIKAPLAADKSEVAAAREKIEIVQKRLSAGESFASLAKEYDQTNKTNGNKAFAEGWVTTDDLDPATAKAVLALNDVGDNSEVFRNDEGFNIINLQGIEKPQLLPFDKVQKQVTKLLAQQQAGQIFAEKSDKLANLTYIHPNTLDEASAGLDLPIQTTDLFTKVGGKSGIIANPKIIAAAFNPDVVSRGNNSEVIELSPDTLVVLRVKDHKPAAIKPLSEVQDTIRNSIKIDIARQKTKELAEKIAKELQNGTNGKALAKQYQLNWIYRPGAGRFDNAIDSAILSQAFHLARPQPDHFNSTIAALSNGNYAIVAITGVHDGDANSTVAAKRKLFQEQLENTSGQIDYELYARGLLKKAKVKITSAPVNNSSVDIPAS